MLQVQRAIYAHQNPADCSKARFLIHSTIPSGVASIMNVETVSLVAALNRWEQAQHNSAVQQGCSSQ